MDYIEIEDLLEELYNAELRSYAKTSLIDDSIFYPTINRVLSTLKVKTKVVKQAIIKIDNFKGELPKDFFKIISAFTCDRYEHTYTNPSIQIDYEAIECLERPCEPPIVSCDGSKYYLNQRFENYTIHYKRITPLNVHKTSKTHCCDSFKSNSKNFISVQGEYLNTEFREGVISLTYESNENDGKIPNYEKLKSAIKTLCVYEAFKVMYLNGEQDIIQKLQFIEPKAVIAENIISLIAKENSFDTFRNWKKHLNSQYMIHDKLTSFR